MHLLLKRCALVFVLSLSPAVLLSDEPGAESAPPPAAGDFDIEALAERAETIVAFIRQHHVDPPAAGEMWLAGTRSLRRSLVARDRRRDDEAPPLETAEARREFLTRTWSREIAPHIPARVKPDDDLLRIFVRGLLPEGVDLVPANEQKIEERVRGNRYSGTGIALTFHKETGFPQIANVIAGGPMERAGGHPTDLIVKVDGRDTHGWTVSQVRDALSGDERTTVKVELRAEADGVGRELLVTRGTITFPTFTGVEGDNYRVEPNSAIRYIELHAVNGSTVHDLQRLESSFRSEGAGAVILDFRGTNGHDLHFALLLADALMDGGTIGRLRTRTHVQAFHADRERLFRDMHVAILVDENTRGAGEWITAALQDNDGAVTIGSQTAGLALVKTFFPLPETNEFLELATGRFERSRTPIDQSPSDGKWSTTEPLIPDLTVDNASLRKGARGSARKSAPPAPLASVKEWPDIQADRALSAAIEELKRRIEAASSRTEP